MNSQLFNVVVYVALATLSAGSGAQTVYKCGNSYSQERCAGGIDVDTRDQRTGDQKKQTDDVTRGNEKVVKKLAAERAVNEAQARAAARNSTPGVVEAPKPAPVRRTPLKQFKAKQPKPEKASKMSPPAKPKKVKKPAATER